MSLTDPHRATVREKLRPVIADDEALDALMSQFPASESDAPATKTDITLLESSLKAEMADLRTELRTEMADLRIEMADLRGELRTEIRDASIRTLSVMVTAMIALNGITVGLVAGVMAALG